MDEYLALPQDFRETLCREASARRGCSAQAIEKDFWVCWTLRELYSKPNLRELLTFKGGTSLSKGWNLIDRFSEDIDLVVDRRVLDFAIEKPSSGQIKKLRRKCQQWISEVLLPDLAAGIGARLGTSTGWTLAIEGQDEDAKRETLTFAFPSLDLGHTAYIRPEVRIELGARSEIEPAEWRPISAYVNDEFPKILGEGTFDVRCITPRRTFLDKMMLLHEEQMRPPEKPRPERLSRHYYDLWCMIRKGIGASIIGDPELVARVSKHRQRFWNQSWIDYETFRNGRWNFSPDEASFESWARDYRAMQEMFFREVPAFETLIEEIRRFQESCNR